MYSLATAHGVAVAAGCVIVRGRRPPACARRAGRARSRWSAACSPRRGDRAGPPPRRRRRSSSSGPQASSIATLSTSTTRWRQWSNAHSWPMTARHGVGEPLVVGRDVGEVLHLAHDVVAEIADDPGKERRQAVERRRPVGVEQRLERGQHPALARRHRRAARWPTPRGPGRPDVASGARPTKENRPQRSPPSTDSRRNPSRSPTTFRNAATGVSVSATISLHTGTMRCSSASRRNSAGDGWQRSPAAVVLDGVLRPRPDLDAQARRALAPQWDDHGGSDPDRRLVVPLITDRARCRRRCAPRRPRGCRARAGSRTPRPAPRPRSGPRG